MVNSIWRWSQEDANQTVNSCVACGVHVGCRRQRRWGVCSSGGGTVPPTKQQWRPGLQQALQLPTCARGAASARPASLRRSVHPLPRPTCIPPPGQGDTVLLCLTHEVHQPVRSLPHFPVSAQQAWLKQESGLPLQCDAKEADGKPKLPCGHFLIALIAV